MQAKSCKVDVSGVFIGGRHFRFTIDNCGGLRAVLLTDGSTGSILGIRCHPSGVNAKGY